TTASMLSASSLKCHYSPSPFELSSLANTVVPGMIMVNIIIPCARRRLRCELVSAPPSIHKLYNPAVRTPSRTGYPSKTLS
ncbi:MAG: hypothetical protein ACPIOQ_53955, partial [Promethearchaeia archaeon]